MTGGGNFGRMKMSHMVADTTNELLEMVDKIGVQRKWIQHPGAYDEHFDVCMSARKKALAAGAKEINFREYAIFCNNRKNPPTKELHPNIIHIQGENLSNEAIDILNKMVDGLSKMSITEIKELTSKNTPVVKSEPGLFDQCEGAKCKILNCVVCKNEMY